jgi:hypothetical protein
VSLDCVMCNKPFGLVTGAMSYWGEYMVKAEKVFKENQNECYPAPSCSVFAEGPIGRGRDITQRGVWHSAHCFLLASTADATDSLGVIDKLIYCDLKITLSQLRRSERGIQLEYKDGIFSIAGIWKARQKYGTCGTQ